MVVVVGWILLHGILTLNNVCLYPALTVSYLFFVLLLLSDRHDLIKKLHALKDTDSDLAGLLLEQVLCPVILLVLSSLTEILLLTYNFQFPF